MKDRLTEHKTTKGITRIVIKPYVEMSEEFQPVADKLCAFEDILEKHGIEDLEQLDKSLIKLIEARAFERKIEILTTELVKEVCEKIKKQCVYCHINGERYYRISPKTLEVIQKEYENEKK